MALLKYTELRANERISTNKASRYLHIYKSIINNISYVKIKYKIQLCMFIVLLIFLPKLILYSTNLHYVLVVVTASNNWLCALLLPLII